MSEIDKQLLRNAEDIVVSLRRQLEDCHPEDRRRREQLTDRLHYHEKRLSERLDYLKSRDRMNSKERISNFIAFLEQQGISVDAWMRRTDEEERRWTKQYEDAHGPQPHSLSRSDRS